MCSNSHPFIRTCWKVRNLKYRPGLDKVLGFVEGLCQNGWLNKRWDVSKLGSFPSFFVLFLGESGGWKLHPYLAGHVWGCWILEFTDSTPLDMKVGCKTMWTRQLFSKLRWFGGAMGFRKHPNKVISNLGFVGSFVTMVHLYCFWRKNSIVPCGHCSSCISLTDVWPEDIPGSDRNSAFCWELCKVWHSGGGKSCDLRDLAVEKKIRDPIRFLRSWSLQTLINFILQLPGSWYTFPCIDLYHIYINP